MGGLDIVTTKIFSLSLFLAALQLTRRQISRLDPFSIQEDGCASLAVWLDETVVPLNLVNDPPPQQVS